jgi:iron complex transport system substrate-binding protein
VTLDPHTLDEVFGSMETVGRRAGVADRAQRVVAGLRARLAAVDAAVRGRARPRVAVIEWIEPVFGAGHWIPDMVEAAGGVPVACHPGSRSVPTTWPAIARARPDVAIVAPCGYGLAGAVEQAAAVTAELPHTEVWAIDADTLVVRPGPHAVDGVEAIASALHPEVVEQRLGRIRRVQPPANARTDAGTSIPSVRSGAAAG